MLTRVTEMEEDDEAGSVYIKPGHKNLPPGYYPVGSIYNNNMRDSMGSKASAGRLSEEGGDDLRGSISDLLSNPTVDRRG